jgi:hypothetical protein
LWCTCLLRRQTYFNTDDSSIPSSDCEYCRLRILFVTATKSAVFCHKPVTDVKNDRISTTFYNVLVLLVTTVLHNNRIASLSLTYKASTGKWNPCYPLHCSACVWLSSDSLTPACLPPPPPLYTRTITWRLSHVSTRILEQSSFLSLRNRRKFLCFVNIKHSVTHRVLLWCKLLLLLVNIKDFYCGNLNKEEIPWKVPQKIYNSVPCSFSSFKINNISSCEQIVNTRFLIQEETSVNTSSFRRNIMW